MRIEHTYKSLDEYKSLNQDQAQELFDLRGHIEQIESENLGLKHDSERLHYTLKMDQNGLEDGSKYATKNK